MTNTKMTKVEILNGAVALLQDNQEAIEIVNGLTEMAKQIEKTNAKRNEKRQGQNNKAFEEIKEILVPQLEEKSMTIDDIKELEQFKDYTTQKVSALLTKLKKEYNIIITLIKVDGKDKKSYKIEK